MFEIFAAAVIAFAAAIIQASFLSHLPSFFSSISMVILAMCVAVVSGFDLEAAVIALVGGSLLDLHGAFGFGTELTAAFAAFVLMKLVFERFLSNASMIAIFVLAALGVASHFLVLAGVDGLRILAGRDPYLLVFDPETLTGPLLSMFTTGTVTIAIIYIGRSIRRITEKIFLSSRLTLKL